MFTKKNLLNSLALSLLVTSAYSEHLHLIQDDDAQTISVYREGNDTAFLVQNAKADFRPFIHPIVAPDGKGVFTQNSPGHHKHQTGLYWAFTGVNGRDYFHHPEGSYWQRQSMETLKHHGADVKWKTVYHLLAEDGSSVMEETQIWTVSDVGQEFLVDLDWSGKALVDLTIKKHAYGGLFLRMPYSKDIQAGALNSNEAKNKATNAKIEKWPNIKATNAQSAKWLNVGMEIEGRDDWGHVALFDHPENPGYPGLWRVDGQYGVGIASTGKGALKIEKGSVLDYKHRFVVYSGQRDKNFIDQAWAQWAGQEAQGVEPAEEAKAEGGVDQYGRPLVPFLTGEEAVAKMTTVDGIEAVLFASDPEISQPIAFCWDDKGRLWVAENRDYETRREGFSASGDSTISILEDTDGDGKMDTKKVFMDDIPFPSAIAVGFDGLWLGTPPNLLFVPDRNHDDKADEEIEVRLTGWGIQDRHEILNSFSWGPDGWLYGCQGVFTRSQVGKPVGEGSVFKAGDAFPTSIKTVDPQYIDGGVWRYHPTKDRFEVVAHGFSNPWGIDWDDKGQLFASMCVIPHIFHVFNGGVYHRQAGRHVNPYVYDDIKTIATHRHRSAHGGLRVYQADLLEEVYRGQAVMANMHSGNVLSDELTAKDSGFVATHGSEMMKANDPQWVGFSIETGPEGAVYVLDWHDTDICGKAVNHKDTGRIFRLAPQGATGITGMNLAALSDDELVELQNHSNDWYVRRSRTLLQYRAASGKLGSQVHQDLWKMFNSNEAVGKKLRALWTLHVTQGLQTEDLLKLLAHPQEYIRGWAIELLCEDKDPGDAALSQFVAMAQSDPSPVVRRYLAVALQRIPKSSVWPIANNLMAHGEDSEDHNIPKLIWFGIEPLVAEDPVAAIQSAEFCQIPLLRTFIARRVTDAKQLNVIVSTITRIDDEALVLDLMKGFAYGARGVVIEGVPEGWPALESKLSASGNKEMQELTLEVGGYLGSAAAVEGRLNTVQDATKPLKERKESILFLAESQHPLALPMIKKYIRDKELSVTALQALAYYGHSADRNDPRAWIPRDILARYDNYSKEQKEAVIQTLVSHKGFAQVLFKALKGEKIRGQIGELNIPKSDISAAAARQMVQLLGPGFKDFWGEDSESLSDKELEIQRYKDMLTEHVIAQADLQNGKQVFQRSCAACHILYDSGGIIGPELTGSNRADLDYILLNIINPNESIGEGYQIVNINTQSGRMFSGNIKSEDDQRVVLNMFGQEFIIPKSDIISRNQVETSMMPEGLLDNLTKEEVRDLIAYLRTEKQID